jgi:hypothetical protein
LYVSPLPLAPQLLAAQQQTFMFVPHLFFNFKR